MLLLVGEAQLVEECAIPLGGRVDQPVEAYDLDVRPGRVVEAEVTEAVASRSQVRDLAAFDHLVGEVGDDVAECGRILSRWDRSPCRREHSTCSDSLHVVHALRIDTLSNALSQSKLPTPRQPRSALKSLSKVSNEDMFCGVNPTPLSSMVQPMIGFMGDRPGLGDPKSSSV